MLKFSFAVLADSAHADDEGKVHIDGIFEEELLNIIGESSHIHLTGYYAGSKLWHSHIHHSPEHGIYMLNLIKKAGYSGMVVSEAKVALQTYEEFKDLNDFYAKWLSNHAGALK